MGNYSKDPDAVLKDALAKGYDRVRFQQGKPILDRELNLLSDLASPSRLAPYIGNGVPALDPLYVEKPEDPAVVDFYLMPGRAIMNGLEVVIPEKISYREQPHKGNLKSQWPSYYAPNNMGWAVLRVFLAEVDDTTDPDLQNQSDIGFETALRQKVDWELLLVDDSYHPDYLLLAEYTVQTKAIVPYVEGWTDRRTQGLTISQIRAELDSAYVIIAQMKANLNYDGTLKPSTVTNQILQDNSVSTQKIQDLAVNSNKLANTAVTNAKLQDLSVGTTKLQDNSVTNPKLQDLSVGTTKLAYSSVDASKLAALSVATGHLQNAAVTNAKIAAGSVTVAQLKFLPIVSGTYTIAASGSLVFTLLASAYQNQDNFIVYSIWGNGDFNWSEFFSGGSRLLKIQNLAASPLVVNVMARRIQES